MSLRLDGKGFSKIIPKLKHAGLLEGGGYSATFADIMQEVATAVMHKFSGVCAFTQSDEVTVRVSQSTSHLNAVIIPHRSLKLDISGVNKTGPRGSQ